MPFFPPKTANSAFPNPSAEMRGHFAAGKKRKRGEREGKGRKRWKTPSSPNTFLVTALQLTALVIVHLHGQWYMLWRASRSASHRDDADAERQQHQQEEEEEEDGW